MGIELASFVAVGDVDHGEVTDTSDLNVVRGLHEVCTSDRTVGDHASAMVPLNTPCHLDALCLSDGRVRAGFRGCEDAPVLKRVNCSPY